MLVVVLVLLAHPPSLHCGAIPRQSRTLEVAVTEDAVTDGLREMASAQETSRQPWLL